MQTKKRFRWGNYLFELLSVFLGVTLAFTLSRWNENRRDEQSEIKTLMEIKNGLQLDLQDIEENILGHKQGIHACGYFRDLIANRPVTTDSVQRKYFILLRDFISIQNSSAYESLKSRGLEIIKNDSLRLQIVSLYDFYFEIIEKLEENYSEMQFNQNYYRDINTMLAPHMEFDTLGRLTDIRQPVALPEKEEKTLLSYLWRVETNRRYILEYYYLLREKIKLLIETINRELE